MHNGHTVITKERMNTFIKLNKSSTIKLVNNVTYMHNKWYKKTRSNFL